MAHAEAEPRAEREDEDEDDDATIGREEEQQGRPLDRSGSLADVVVPC